MRTMIVVLGLVALASVSVGCQRGTRMRASSLGEREPLSLESAARGRLEADLATAERVLVEHPDDAMSWIWVGRRLAYLGRYDEAIEVFTAGLVRHPESFKLLRHRGHRYITTRRFELAEADLARAAALSAGWMDELEPDGAPNAAGIPISTTKSNIYYHLGLARYLQGDFEGALEAYRACEPYSAVNDDNRVSTAYWLVLSLRRLGQYDEAGARLALIEEELTLYENHVYHELLLLFKTGEMRQADTGDAIGSATFSYGVAAYSLSDPGWARQKVGLSMCRSIVSGDADGRAAFGYIAAEAEVARADGE